MIWLLVLSFTASALTTLLVIASAHRHARWSADHDLSGPQKMHSLAVPRIGGIGIAAGMLVGLLALWVLQPESGPTAAFLALAAAPACAFGLIEDFTKNVLPRWRLIAAMVSALLGYVLLGATLPGLGYAPFDEFLMRTGLMLAITLVAVAGVVHSVNIIDGMNGLASMSIAIMSAALAYVGFQVGDALVGGLALVALGAVLGLFIWNYPRGLIFLGDGGAYLLGFLIAEIALLLVARNPSVSPLLPLVLVAYPVFETMFTMYRRGVLQRRPVSRPDGIHLHTLLYRRLMRWALGRNADAQTLVHCNSRTSPMLWVLASIAVLPASVWWHNTPALFGTLVLFVAAYLYLYWRIVRFRTPGWLISHAHRHRS
jgi:UDP-N-acetylmuramyl pentapeptide phosphotransferase/UDP-N-acetylglucosamine-1-phosphate transferase